MDPDTIAALREDKIETAADTYGRAITQRPPGSTDDADDAAEHLGSTLPYTTVLPESVTVEGPPWHFACGTCGRAGFTATLDGLARASRCHGPALTDLPRESIPVVRMDVPLEVERLRAKELTVPQAGFLQLLRRLERGAIDRRAFDLLRDSTTVLREYVGADIDAVRQLRDRNLISIQLQRPHRVYALTQAGRDRLEQPLREGLDFGAGTGDLGQGAGHLLMVEVLAAYVDQGFVADLDHPVTEVATFYEPTEVDGRLDVAGLTPDGAVHVAAEAELGNNDLPTAAPADFRLMAALEPAQAVWLAPTRAIGHAILEALADPAEGAACIEQTYSQGYDLRKREFDTPGLTEIYRLEYLYDRIIETDG